MNERDAVSGLNGNSLTRRHVLRVIGGAALAAVPAVAIVSEASAGRTWCRTDPVLKIDGQTVDVFISSYTDMNTSATGPTQIVVQIPIGSTGSVLATDNGFGGKGYFVSFSTVSTLSKSANHTQVQVSVYQPAKDSTLPVQVSFTPRATGVLTGASNTAGRANKWVVLKTS